VRAFEKVLLLTKKTALEELVARYNTERQAAFYLERMGIDFDEYRAAHRAYAQALQAARAAVPPGVKCQCLERSHLPTYLPGPEELPVALGPDGLVVNAAKYLQGQPLLAVNPDPSRIDGLLLPFTVPELGPALARALAGEYEATSITMAKASFNDGQRLYALNDLFVGQRTHVSARYALSHRGRRERQSSSGIIVSTGAGSTGWFRSVITGASAILEAFAGAKEARAARERYRFPWDAPYLCYSVREPFVSRTSSAEMVFGRLEGGEELEVVSQMPHGGAVFSDGVEEDYVEFNSGAIVRIGLAEKSLRLIRNPGASR